MAITDWPLQERPRERLFALGAGSLADAELLAILLRTGVKGKSAVDVARQLLGRFGSVAALLEAGSGSLAETPGLGSAKLAQLQAALELARRALKEEISSRDALSSPRGRAPCRLPSAGCCSFRSYRLIEGPGRPIIRPFRAGAFHGTRLPGNGQEAPGGTPRFPRQQQNHTQVLPEPAVPPLLGGKRKALGKAAHLQRRRAHHRQEGHRRGAQRAARARRDLARGTPLCARRSSSNPRPAPATSTRPPRTSAPRPTRSR